MPSGGCTDQENVTHTHRRGYYSALKTEENPTIWDYIWDNMDGASSHYAKQNKQNTENEILHDLSCMWTLKQSNSWKQKLGWRKVGKG